MSRKGWESFVNARANPGYGDVKRHKYGAKATVTADGIRHPSVGQARRWEFLLKAQQYGLIANLRREVPFDLVVNGVKVCRYVADHVFDLAGDMAREVAGKRTGVQVVEDYKGTITDVARIKMALYKAVYGDEVHVVKTAEGPLY